MTIMRNYFFLLLFAAMAWGGCSEIMPCGFDKAQYMDNFKSFMDSANDMDANASESSWKSMDARFEELSESCFNEWENELSFGDKAKVAGWVLKYQYIRYGKPLLEGE